MTGWRRSDPLCAPSRRRQITPSEGAALATIVKSYTDAIDMADVVKRLDALEAQIRGPER